MNHLEIKIKNFGNALSRLKEALDEHEEDKFKPDLCVHRFEFTYEICWKTLQSVLREKGVIASSPRDVFDKAYKNEIIESMDVWLRMKNDRNDTTHEYDEEKALEIYKHVLEYVKEFEFVLEKLKTEN